LAPTEEGREMEFHGLESTVSLHCLSKSGLYPPFSVEVNT
jgi:hypothetical protein